MRLLTISLLLLLGEAPDATKPPRVEAGKIVKEGEAIIQLSRHGTVEKPGDVADNRSYAVWTYPDGSTMLLKSAGTSTLKADGKRVISGTQTCVEGTGRFANVDCTIDWAHTPQESGLYAGTYSGTITPRGQS